MKTDRNCMPDLYHLKNDQESQYAQHLSELWVRSTQPKNSRQLKPGTRKQNSKLRSMPVSSNLSPKTEQVESWEQWYVSCKIWMHKGDMASYRSFPQIQPLAECFKGGGRILAGSIHRLSVLTCILLFWAYYMFAIPIPVLSFLLSLPGGLSVLCPWSSVKPAK